MKKDENNTWIWKLFSNRLKWLNYWFCHLFRLEYSLKSLLFYFFNQLQDVIMFIVIILLWIRPFIFLLQLFSFLMPWPFFIAYVMSYWWTSYGKFDCLYLRHFNSGRQLLHQQSIISYFKYKWLIDEFVWSHTASAVTNKKKLHLMLSQEIVFPSLIIKKKENATWLPL